MFRRLRYLIIKYSAWMIISARPSDPKYPDQVIFDAYIRRWHPGYWWFRFKEWKRWG